jgi:hypothetical protein
MVASERIELKTVIAGPPGDNVWPLTTYTDDDESMGE